MNYNVSHDVHNNPHGFGKSFNSLVAAGSVRYQRRLHLQQLLPVTLIKIDDHSLQNCRWIIARLASALRHERNRGRRAHWAYSLNRHVALLQAYRGEQRFLEELKD